MRCFLYIIILLSLALQGCCNRQTEVLLDEAEDCIAEWNMDKCLLIIEGIGHENLTRKRDLARYSLLKSILYNDYLDTISYSIIQPAANYYAKRGSDTERLRMWYCLGQLHQQHRDWDTAMECYVKGVEYSSGCSDFTTKAKMYAAQGEIYSTILNYSKSAEAYIKSADAYKKSESNYRYINSISHAIIQFVLEGKKESAEKYLKEAKEFKTTGYMGREITPYTKDNTFLAANITYLLKYSTPDSIATAIENYSKHTASHIRDWLTIAECYINLENFNCAQGALKNYLKYSKEKDKKLYLLSSQIYEGLGEYRSAVQEYKIYTAAADSINRMLANADAKFYEEKHNLELNAAKEREQRMLVVFIWISSVLLFSTVILKIRRHLKQQREKYRSLYLQMEQEREHLQEILDNSVPPAAAKESLINRLNLLNKFFAAHITENYDKDTKAIKELERLLADKDKFIISTRLSFEGSNPTFIKHLKEKNLTDWEIGYCCLYALGLKGREIGEYINLPSHYNNSSIIREKLGITSHDTNLGIYIRNLLNTTA